MTPPHTLGAFVWYFVKQQPWAFLIIFITTVTWAVDQTVWPLVLQVVIDTFALFEDNRTAAWPALRDPVIWSLVLWAGVEMGFRLQGLLLARSLPKIEAGIRLSLFDHVQRHSPKYFNDHLAGSLATKIGDMTTEVSALLRDVLVLYIPSVFAILLACFFLYDVHPIFALLLVGWIFAHLAICVWFSRGCDRRQSTHADVRSQLMGKIVDSLTNHFIVNLYYRFHDEKERLTTHQEQEQQAHVRTLSFMEGLQFALGALGFIISGLLINGLIVVYWMNQELTTGQAIQVFNTVWNMVMVIWYASSKIPSTFRAIGIAKQALSLLRDKQDIADVPTAKPLTVYRGEIVFDKVAFYHGQKKIFENKSVHIAAGSRVGLVGFSGAGKSTFISLILRLFRAKKGRITIDGQDIADVTLESLRRQVSLIPQEPLLFHRSIMENIRFGRPDATYEEVVEAAIKAHCVDFVSRLPEGFQSCVGERGSKLSGGERQRIAIARAMLADAPILLLDEATSALDSMTEKTIQSSLHTLMKGRTSIVIAHRLTTLEHMDRILVFDRGKIVEDGSHKELLQMQGHYAKLWQMQTGGFLPNPS